MGSLLLTAGSKGKRFSLPNSRIMIHQPHGAVKGQATDIQIQAKEILALKAKINDIFVKSTNQSLDVIEKYMDRDTFLSPEEAKKFGLIDEVIKNR